MTHHSTLSVQNTIRAKNEALRTIFDGLKAKGEKNIRLIPSAGMIGTDDEATVDGTHFTDLGFQRYADYLYPEILQILEMLVDLLEAHGEVKNVL